MLWNDPFYKIRISGIFAAVILCCFHASAQNGSLRGNISSNGKKLASVSVIIEKTKWGTTTNSSGEFEVKNLPAGTYEVRISAIGYQSERIPVTIRNNAVTLLNIALKEEQSKLNEVVVTGLSRAAAIRKNPIPIVVVSKKEMDLNLNNNIIDAIVKEAPGLSAVTTGPNISKPFIRGLGYNRVLTMYDGIRQEGQQWGDEHGIEIDQYGITRVEVLKGPATLTYGSDALAGVINMIPYTPVENDGKIKGDALMDYHSNNGLIGSSLGLSYKKNDWEYVFRASEKMAHDYRNKIDGYVYATAFREYNLSGMMAVDKKWGFLKVAATLYDNKQEIPDGSRDSLTRKFSKQVYEVAEDTIKDRPVVPEYGLKTYHISTLHQHIQHYRVYLQNKIILGHGDLNLILGWQQSIRREYDHPTLRPQAGLFVVLNTYNYDLKYNFPQWKGFETTVGANGMVQTNSNKNATDFPIPDYHLFSIGPYFFVKKSFDKINITAGMRFDSRDIDWNNFYTETDPLTGFNKQAHTPDTSHASLQFPAFAHSYKGVSGSIGATYNISEGILVKANIGRGYRAPNITEIGSNGLDPGAHIVYLGNRSFKPEFSLQEDIGFLAYLKSVDLTIELFNNNIENYIYQAKLYNANGQPVIVVPGNSTYQYKQSKAQLYGVEICFNFHPQAIPWFFFNNSLSVVEGLNRNDSLINKDGNAAKYLPFIPPLHTRSEIRATFNETKGMLSHVYARMEMEYYAAQNHFYGVDNTETATAGYELFNIGCGLMLRNRQQKDVCQLFLQVDNLFNKAYQSHLNRLKYFEYYKSSPNGHLGIYNMGRNLSIKLIVPFQ